MFPKSIHTSIRTHHILLILGTAFALQTGFYDVSSMLTIIPEKVVHGNEWWRIISHLAGVNSWWIALLGLVVYYVLGRETEKMTNDGVFPIGLIISGAITGLVYSLLPFSCPPMGAGLFGMLYAAALTMNISHSSALHVSAFVKLRLTIASTMLIGLGMLVLTLGFLNADSTIVYKNSFEAGFGILSGLCTGIVWTHMRNAARIEAISEARSSFVKTAQSIPVIVEQHVRYNQQQQSMVDELSHDESRDQQSEIEPIDSVKEEDEVIANRILEKIHRVNIENLTREEIEFLNKYSQSL